LISLRLNVCFSLSCFLIAKYLKASPLKLNLNSSDEFNSQEASEASAPDPSKMPQKGIEQFCHIFVSC